MLEMRVGVRDILEENRAYVKPFTGQYRLYRIICEQNGSARSPVIIPGITITRNGAFCHV
jgi:hypothetical protein